MTKLSQKAKHLYKIGCLIILSICIYNILSNAIICYKYKYSELPKSHVYVCDNPRHKSDFDNWLKDIGLDWVPSYIIIKDGKVLDIIRGGISEKTFTDNLEVTLNNNMFIDELPEYSIENLNGNRESVHDLFSQGIYILEIHWIDCPDCIYQDTHYTAEIYNKYTTRYIYRYYINSEKSDVLNKYK